VLACATDVGTARARGGRPRTACTPAPRGADRRGGLDDEAARDAALQATFVAGATTLELSGIDTAAHISGGAFRYAGISSLVADGTPDAVWFAATFTSTHQRRADEPEGPLSQDNWFPERYTGLAVRDHGWKLVAVSPMLHLTGPSKFQRPTDPVIRYLTLPGPLTALVLSGPTLAASLSPTAIVLQPDRPEAGRGPSALGPWATRELALDRGARELHGAGWAMVQADVKLVDGSANLGIFAVAIPRPGGGWTPVFVQYAGQ
jgi:hypothetical protein